MNKRRLRVDVVPFKRLAAGTTAQVRTRAGEIGKALGAEKTEVRFG
jgi:hypothetical protein